MCQVCWALLHEAWKPRSHDDETLHTHAFRHEKHFCIKRRRLNPSATPSNEGASFFRGSASFGLPEHLLPTGKPTPHTRETLPTHVLGHEEHFCIKQRRLNPSGTAPSHHAPHDLSAAPFPALQQLTAKPRSHAHETLQPCPSRRAQHFCLKRRHLNRLGTACSGPHPGLSWSMLALV